nr:hypothetical protein Iba_chr13dCG8310 [Ipomoea batatas]
MKIGNDGDGESDHGNEKSDDSDYEREGAHAILSLRSSKSSMSFIEKSVAIDTSKVIKAKIRRRGGENIAEQRAISGIEGSGAISRESLGFMSGIIWTAKSSTGAPAIAAPALPGTVWVRIAGAESRGFCVDVKTKGGEKGDQLGIVDWQQGSATPKGTTPPWAAPRCPPFATLPETMKRLNQSLPGDQVDDHPSSWSTRPCGSDGRIKTVEERSNSGEYLNANGTSRIGVGTQASFSLKSSRSSSPNSLLASSRIMTSDSNFSHLPSYSFNKAETQESTRMRMELQGLESGHKQAFHLRAQEAQEDPNQLRGRESLNDVELSTCDSHIIHPVLLCIRHLPSYSFNKAETQESTRMRMELQGLESGHKQAFHLRAQEAQDSNFSHLPSYSFNKAATQESTRMRMELQGLESGYKQAFHLKAQEAQGNRKSAGVVFSSISAKIFLPVGTADTKIQPVHLLQMGPLINMDFKSFSNGRSIYTITISVPNSALTQ